MLLEYVYDTPTDSPPDYRRFQAIRSPLYLELATLSVWRMEPKPL